MSLGLLDDLYLLAPIQEGLLFHSLAAQGSTMYIEQSTWVFRGDLDVDAYREAWQEAIDRHTILRTSFLWREADEPMQVVVREAKLPLQEEDWRGLGKAEQQARLERLLDDERTCGFDLERAPLLRLVLIRLDEHAHQFVWTHHHLLLDGWSVSLLLTEVLRRYAALRTGQKLDVAPAAPYREFVAWVRGQDPAEAERFWRTALHGFSTPTRLSAGFGAEGSRLAPHRPAEHVVYVPLMTTSALQTLSRRERVTMNTLVQGAWAVLLSRYTAESDVLFGSTASIRPPTLPDVESMLGLLVNTVPVRVAVPAEARLIPWLKDLQAHQIEARGYAYSPLSKIQRWSDVPRDQSLFETLLIFENYPLNELGRAAPDLPLTVTDVRSFTHTNYPLTVLVQPGGQLILRLVADPELFDRESIERLGGHLVTLLDEIAANPDQKLSQLSLLTPAERQQVLVEWNLTDRPYPRDRTVSELFAEQAARTPDAVAVVFGDDSITYRQLDERANQLAHHLRTLGVGAETLVAICVDRSLELAIGLLGILKAGGAYVPLDPSYPSDRLAFMLQDSAASVLIGQRTLESALPEQRAQTVWLDADRELIASRPTTAPQRLGTAENTAYVIYTSGSTGRPKGVQIPGRALTNLLWSMRETLGLSSADTLVAVTTLSFDIAGLELWLPLILGGRVVLASRQDVTDGLRLRRLLESSRATVLQATPSTWRLVLDTDWRPAKSFTALCGGEALGRELAMELVQRCGRVWNMYGPTETTIWSTCQRLEPGLERVLIGRPIANTRLYVLDQQQQPLPIGVPGELFIGGDGVARGYLNRPELTAERFVADVFGPCPGARLYRTGDLVRYRADGRLEYLGRLDHQVKVRGFRIELGEIEAVLDQHPNVREAVIVARQDLPGETRLVAYVVPENGTLPAVEQLRAFLKRQLPGYMLPSAFVSMDELPRTPNAKVDRRALPVPDKARPEMEARYVPPLTLTEQSIATIWSDTLQVQRVGVHDNFFDLGGDSLLAMRVHRRLEAALQREVKMTDLFEYPTVSALARHLSGAAEAPVIADARARGQRGRGARSSRVHALRGVRGERS